VVYACGTPGSGWTARCLRQSDLILTVARADEPPVPAAAVEAAADWVSEELVLVHAGTTRRSQGAARWLAGRTIRRHHVRPGDLQDFARLARASRAAASVWR